MSSTRGRCWRCGGQLYENLVHACSTGGHATNIPRTAPVSRPVDEALRIQGDAIIEAFDSRDGILHAEAVAALVATVRAEIERLREERDQWKWVARETADNLHSTIRIREQRVEAAEAENRRLTEGLRDLESAVRILEVMLREPAAEGLMSAEDYRAYLSGAWLGVDEAVEKARALLAASPSDGANTEGGEA